MKKRLLAWILAIACLVNAAPISVFASEIEETAPVTETVVSTQTDEAAPEEAVEPASELDENDLPAVEYTEETTAPATEPAAESGDPVTEPESTITDNTCGANVTWTLDDSGTLTLSGSGEMNDYGSPDGAPWYAQFDSILSVVVEDGVLSIGSNAFAQCKNLTTVTIAGNGITIWDDAFSDCPALDSVFFQGDVPEGICANSFTNVTASVYYPANNPTWTTDSMLDFGGTLSWIPYCPNGHNYVTEVTPGSCVTDGFTTYTCIDCGYRYTDNLVIAPGHSYIDGICINCGISFTAPEVSIVSSSDGQIHLVWTASDLAVSYGIYRSSSMAGPFEQITTTATAGYTDSTALVGESYYYYVTAISSDGTSSDPSNIVYGTRIPGSPTVSGSNVASSGKIRVSWDAVEGAVAYKVYRSTSKDSGYSLKFTTTTTRYTNTGVEAGDVFYYYVVAVSENGLESAASNIIKRVCDLPRPVVSVSNVPETGKVRLTWEPVEGAVKYRIYRSTTKNSGFKNVYNVTGTTYTHISGEPGVRYYYKVVAVHENESASSANSATISRICDCAMPVIDAFAGSSGKPRVTWKPVEGAVSYKVYRSDSPNGTYTLKYTTSGTGYTNTGAEVGVPYYYKVKAVPSNVMGSSAFSNTDSCKGVKNDYQYVYSRYSLSKSSTYARQTNLRLACKAINGTILAPGEVFSFNDIVGRRTEKKGYMVAGQVGGEGLGGGICQVSSVIFNAALLGNMTITKRWQHSVHPSYCPKGRDAMIYGTSNNLRFRNDSDYYIKIKAVANGGTVTVTLLTREAGVSPKDDVKLRVKKTGSNTYTLTRTFQGVVNYTVTSTYVS